MNEFLIAALALLVTFVPCGVVCARAPMLQGLVALEVVGVAASLVLLLLAAGLDRQPFADLGLVAALLSFAGAVAFVRFLERRL
jgi:multisubunit Na+/H+ antiporter MnhF subunit